MTKYSYYDTVPSDVKASTLSKEIQFNSNYYLSDDIIYDSDVNYTINNSMGSSIFVTLTYYSDYTSPNIVLKGNEIDISYFNHSFKLDTDAYNKIKSNLKKYQVYNYTKLYKVSVNITANEQNINKLRYFTTAN